MNPPFAQLIVGSWELIRTTDEAFNPKWHVDHFSIDGQHSSEMPDVPDFIHPAPYRVEGDTLIYIWEDWGRPNIRCQLFLEKNGYLKVIDHKGFISHHRRIITPNSEFHAYIESSGKLKRNKTKSIQRASPLE